MSSGHKRYRCDANEPGFANESHAKKLHLESGVQATSSLTTPAQCSDIKEDVEMGGVDLPERLHDHICYGTLVSSKAKLICSEASKLRRLPWDRFHRFRLDLRDGQYHLVSNSEGESPRDLGVLDVITQGYLDALISINGLAFEAVVASSALGGPGQGKKRKTDIVDASVNIMGLETLADSVGDVLDSSQVSLQHPMTLPPGMRYVNPQWWYATSERTDLSHLVGPLVGDSNSRRISNLISAALGSLDRPETFQGQLFTDASGSVPPSEFLRTKLKPHQADGVQFILSREDPSCRQELLVNMKALVGPQYFSGIYTLSAGGILADVMGLGKTLTTISAIAASKATSKAVGDSEMNNSGISCSRATLVVATSRRMNMGAACFAVQRKLTKSPETLDVWVAEVERHVIRETLSTVTFHGDNRARSADALLDCDIVFTTYATLAADWKSGRVLQSICWFRVVLDEAHWIRNQSSQQFKAATALQADMRWCLTGTPIQNSLEDLRSLLKFLHFEPFATRSMFEKHILEPLRSDSNGGFRNLKILLRSICLRRNSSYLDLPQIQVEKVSVPLGHGEKLEQARILDECRKQFDMVVSKNSSQRKHSIIFAAVKKLQQLFSHGVPPRNYLSPKDLTVAAEYQLVCKLCSNEDEDVAALLESETVCPECSRELHNNSKSHRVRQGARPSGSVSSPGPKSPSPGLLQQQQGENGSRMIAGGNSTKLNAVVENLEQHQASSKSLVFSFWRLTLDTLAAILESRGVNYIMIDGRVTGEDRQKLLGRFQHDPEVRALLISISTGAVGLTLTAATRVHIVEPQWNPAQEEQAIARAHRMGQSQAVTVVRYITQNSVEQKIVQRQERKQRIATLSLDSSCAEDDANERLEDLKFVLDIGAS